MQKATKRTVWFMRFRSCKLAFGPPAMVDKRDLAIIKASGLNFSKIQLAQFRSYRPGYLPWFLTAEEASHLVCALTQTLAVASRFITEADVIPFNKDPEDRDYLIRILRFKDSTPFCDDSIVTVDPPPTQLLPFGLDDTTLGKLQEFPRSEAWKLTLLFFPQELEEVNERPRLIYALLTVDSASDFIVGVVLMEAIDGVDLMYANVAETLASDWMQHQIVAQEITVRSPDY